MENLSSSSNLKTGLRRWDYLILFITGLIVSIGIVTLQPVPGYMDADYYYAGGKQLASGNGFSDPFIWNYLGQPKQLPYPSNSYWNPLASIIAAGGMVLTGKINFLSARLGFILLAVLDPLIISAIAFRLTKKRVLAMTAGFLAIFCGYYLPFIVTTDNYSLYLFTGGLFFLVLDKLSLPKAFLLGLLAGVFNLARGDGLLWLPLTLLAVTVPIYRQYKEKASRSRWSFAVISAVLVFLGYMVVMAGWYARNLATFGALLPPGSGHVLWMTKYGQLFSFYPELFTFHTWLANGLWTAVQERLLALWQNFGTAFFAEGMVILFPLILIGIWKNRHMWAVQIGVIGWLSLYLAESLIFPFASIRGGFFHAGTAFQALWFALTPAGLDYLVSSISRRNAIVRRFSKLLPVILVLILGLFSVMLVKIRVIDSGWNEGEYLYQEADRFLTAQGAKPTDVVVVRNPPAYFIMTGREAIVVPYGDVQTLLQAARKYNADYVILEETGKTDPLYDLFEHPENYPEFTNLENISDNHILSINKVP